MTDGVSKTRIGAHGLDAGFGEAFAGLAGVYAAALVDSFTQSLHLLSPSAS